MKSIISLLPAKGSLPDFLNKLRAKKQTEAQQQQASHAISLYYDLVHAGAPHNKIPATNVLCSEAESPSGKKVRNRSDVPHILQIP